MHLEPTQSVCRSNSPEAGAPSLREGDEHAAPICFRSARTAATASCYQPVKLSSASAGALAELLQVLGCGEESAALTFDHLGRSGHGLPMRSALMGIAADERRHQMLLGGLTASLPPPRHDASLGATLRRFFMRLADRDVLVHFVRIVAIDSAVCQILRALCGRGKPLDADTRISSILERIRCDEARHVAIASRCATPLLKSARGRDIAAEARERLTDVLRLRADSLDTLAVAPDALFVRLRALPRLTEGAGAY